jgi:hypothetical protein
LASFRKLSFQQISHITSQNSALINPPFLVGNFGQRASLANFVSDFFSWSSHSRAGFPRFLQPVVPFPPAWSPAPFPPRRCFSCYQDSDRTMGDNRDKISELPDVVLLSTLSHLPLCDAGRTAILSTRCHGLFDQSLLNFNAYQPFPPEEGRECDWMIRAVTDILRT